MNEYVLKIEKLNVSGITFENSDIYVNTEVVSDILSNHFTSKIDSFSKLIDSLSTDYDAFSKDRVILQVITRLLSVDYYSSQEIMSYINKNGYNFLNKLLDFDIQNCFFINLKQLINQGESYLFVKISNLLLKKNPSHTASYIIGQGLNELSLSDKDYNAETQNRILDLKLTCMLYK